MSSTVSQRGSSYSGELKSRKSNLVKKVSEEFGWNLNSFIFALHYGNRGRKIRGKDRRFGKKEKIVLTYFGSVVQLVRMPPCHGGGRGFESRPVRN